MQNHVKISDIVCKKQNLLESDIDSERVMMCLTSNEYYGLNEVASRIWELMQSKIKVRLIINWLLDEYEIEESQCTKEVLSFLNKLADNNLIEIYEG